MTTDQKNKDNERYCEFIVKACIDEYDRLSIKIPDRQLKILRNFLWFSASITGAQIYLLKFHLDRTNQAEPFDFLSLLFIVSIFLSVINICIGISALTISNPYSFPFGRARNVFKKSIIRVQNRGVEYGYSEICRRIEDANNIAAANISSRYARLKVIQDLEIISILLTASLSFSLLFISKNQIYTTFFAMMFVVPLFLITRSK